MDFFAFVLKNASQAAVETEIMYNVASARANGKVLLKFVADGEAADKILLHSIRVLKRLKRDGRIKLFVPAEEIGGSTTEAEYMRNKRPDAVELCGSDANAIMVMI